MSAQREFSAAHPTAHGVGQWAVVCRDFAIYLLVRMIICIIQALPLRSCERLCTGLAYLFCRILRVRHSVVEDNLKHAFPNDSAERRAEIEFGMWRHLFLMICEIALASRKIHESNWRSYIQITNRRPLVQAFLDPRPVVAVTAHFGNFEMCGYASGLLGFPTYTIARTLDNLFLHRYLMKFRAATGQYILPTKGSAAEAQAVIEAGEALALLGDHYGGKKGCWAEFFHRPASCHKAISLFCLANNAPLVIVYTKRRQGILEFELVFDAVFDPETADASLRTVPDLTQWYNNRIESAVRLAPEQYWWLHRRWKDPRQAERRKRLDSSHPVPESAQGRSARIGR